MTNLPMRPTALGRPANTNHAVPTRVLFAFGAAAWLRWRPAGAGNYFYYGG